MNILEFFGVNEYYKLPEAIDTGKSKFDKV